MHDRPQSRPHRWLVGDGIGVLPGEASQAMQQRPIRPMGVVLAEQRALLERYDAIVAEQADRERRIVNEALLADTQQRLHDPFFSFR